MPTEKAKRYTQEEKDELVELFRRSGKSALRFCKEHPISYQTLRRWLGSTSG